MNEISIVTLPSETLIQMANEAAELAERDLKSAVNRAWDCGRYLVAARDNYDRGATWQAWLRANFDRDIRTAYRYMQLAEAYPSEESLLGLTSIRSALRVLSQSDVETAVLVEIEQPEEEPAEDAETQAEQPERETQERPSIRKVSAEARRISEADREPTPEVRPVAEPELVEATEDAVVLYVRDGGGYAVADPDDVAVAALQLYDPLALVRIAVLAVEPADRQQAIDELEQAILWLRSEIEEAGGD